MAVVHQKLVILELYNNGFFRPVPLTCFTKLLLAVIIVLGMSHWISAPQSEREHISQRLARQIIAAQGGTIYIEDNLPRVIVFIIKLKSTPP